MTYRSNTFKAIRKGLMGPNIIFPAAYILFSGETMCTGGENKVYISPVLKTNQVKEETNGIEGLNGATADALGVKSLSGRGTLLNLGDYQCGVFVASETKEAFIVKLPCEDGWMSLCKEDKESGRLYLRYDAAPDPRMIKVDRSLVRLLRQHLGQSPSDWHDIAFYYKAPIGDKNIFTEDGITPSTAFKKELYKKFSTANGELVSLISSQLSIQGSVTSDTLKDLEKVGFLLVKDASSLVNLVKNMLESDPEWGTKAAVVETKDYIICPAALVGDALKADATDLDVKSQDQYTSLRLEGYASAYCYLKHGEYYRLIPLDHLKSSITIDKEPLYQPFTRITTSAVIPPEEPVDKDETESKDKIGSKDETDGQSNGTGSEDETIAPTGTLESMQGSNPNQDEVLPIDSGDLPPSRTDDELAAIFSGEHGNGPSVTDAASDSQSIKSNQVAGFMVPEGSGPVQTSVRQVMPNQNGSVNRSAESVEPAVPLPLLPPPMISALSYIDGVIQSTLPPSPISNESVVNSGSILTPPPPPSMLDVDGVIQSTPLPPPTSNGFVVNSGSPPPPPPPLPPVAFGNNMSSSVKMTDKDNKVNNNSNGSTLLDQLKEGVKLKSTAEGTLNNKSPQANNSRDALMANIRNHNINKKVDYSKVSIEDRIAANKQKAADCKVNEQPIEKVENVAQGKDKNKDATNQADAQAALISVLKTINQAWHPDGDTKSQSESESDSSDDEDEDKWKAE